MTGRLTSAYRKSDVLRSRNVQIKPRKHITRRSMALQAGLLQQYNQKRDGYRATVMPNKVWPIWWERLKPKNLAASRSREARKRILMRETIRNLVGWGFCLLLCAHCLAQNDQPLRFDAASIKLRFDVASIRHPERDEMIALEMDILHMLKTGPSVRPQLTRSRITTASMSI